MSIRAALARPAFRGLLLGQVVSIIGDRLNYLALVALQSAHAARVGADRAALLAALAWAMLGPSLVVSPWAGALVDRWPLVRTLLVTDLLRAFVVAAIPLAYLWTGSLAPVVVLVALAYVLNAFFLPARSALPPHLVDAPLLAAANAVLVLGGVVATLVGAALGGPLVDRFGASVGLWIDAATYAVSVLALATILRHGIEGRPPAASRAAPVSMREAMAHAWSDVVEGWRIALARGGVRAPLVAWLATWIAGAVLHVAGTSHVQRGGVRVTEIGLLIAALALGASGGTAWTLARERRRPDGGDGVPDRRPLLALGILGAGVGLVVFAAARTLPWMIAAGLFVGVFAAPVFFLAETAVQEAVDAGRRARVFAARDVISRAAFLLTAAATAPLVRWYGDAVAIGVGGALLVLIGIGLAVGSRAGPRRL